MQYVCTHLCGRLRATASGDARVSVNAYVQAGMCDVPWSLRACPMQAWLEQRRSLGDRVPTLWSGMEISALLKGCLVHVLALGFEQGHKALQPYNQGDAVVGEPLRAEAVVNAIHRAGGLAVLAHPARYRLSHAVLIEEAARLGFDGGTGWSQQSTRI